jgi:hypothetical protein
MHRQVALCDVQIGAAHTTRVHSDEQFVARRTRYWDGDARMAVNSVNHHPPAAVSRKKLSRNPPINAPMMPMTMFIRIPEPPPLTIFPAIHPARAPMMM